MDTLSLCPETRLQNRQGNFESLKQRWTDNTRSRPRLQHQKKSSQAQATKDHRTSTCH